MEPGTHLADPTSVSEIDEIGGYFLDEHYSGTFDEELTGIFEYYLDVPEDISPEECLWHLLMTTFVDSRNGELMILLLQDKESIWPNILGSLWTMMSRTLFIICTPMMALKNNTISPHKIGCSISQPTGFTRPWNILVAAPDHGTSW